MVWPSGGDLATKFAPMVVPDPGRFSTTKGWPKRRSNPFEKYRAIASVPPPAA